MKFVIQQNLMDEKQLQATKRAVEKYPHICVGVIPFSTEITSNEPLEGTDFIPYGSTLFTKLTKDLGWKGVHFDLAMFNYEAACSNRDDMLNGEHILNINDAVEFLGCQFVNGEWFTRPSEDLKQFSGQVMFRDEIVEFFRDAVECQSSGSYQLSPDTMVVLAEPKNIQAEWRWFVVGGKVVDGSMYRANGQLIKLHENDQEVISEAQTLADKWLPDPCCVMDTALVGNKLKVIEFNCINSSGTYNHNTASIFTALYKYHIGD